jgi:hypothetical protein
VGESDSVLGVGQDTLDAFTDLVHFGDEEVVDEARSEGISGVVES